MGGIQRQTVLLQQMFVTCSRGLGNHCLTVADAKIAKLYTIACKWVFALGSAGVTVRLNPCQYLYWTTRTQEP